MHELVVALSPKEHKRIFNKIIVNESTKCWEWIGSKDQSGYGLLWYKGRTERIHRVLYAFFVNPIPRETITIRKQSIDHLCRNHSCCNPEHLELVTQKENGLRGVGLKAINAKKTHCKYGHPYPSYNGKARHYCRTCDSIRHKKRMQGENREYWLKKAREAYQRYKSKK